MGATLQWALWGHCNRGIAPAFSPVKSRGEANALVFSEGGPESEGGRELPRQPKTRTVVAGIFCWTSRITRPAASRSVEMHRLEQEVS